MLRVLAATGDTRDVIVAPIGFLSDHIEILWDLDTEAKALAEKLGLNMIRAGTVGSHPDFVRMIVELIDERARALPKVALGKLPASHDVCPADCCLYTPSRPRG